MVLPKIDVIIPTIPGRTGPGGLLERAIQSASTQTLRFNGQSHVALDSERQGAAATRTRALMMSKDADWVAFLDDDDMMMPNHLRVLYDHAMETGADYVFSYYMVRDPLGRDMPNIDPLGHLHRKFDPTNPHHTTITTMVRRELAQQIGFRRDETMTTHSGEDWLFTLDCLAAGANISNPPGIRTWWWTHHAGNTSGLARW